MDYNELIDKYFSGTTSREDEDVLRRYLMRDDLPAEIMEQKELLLAMLQPAEIDCTEAMAELSAMIETLAAKESAAAHRTSVHRVVLRYISPSLAVAAILLLMFLIVPSHDKPVHAPGAEYIAEVEGYDTVTVQQQAVVDGDAVAVLPEAPEPLTGAIDKNEGNVSPRKELLASAADDMVTIECAELPEEQTTDVHRSGAIDSDIYIGSLATKDNHSLSRYENVFVLSEPPLRLSYTQPGQDTYSDPEDVVNHFDALLIIFSDAASDGIKEQEMHLKRLAVLNGE